MKEPYLQTIDPHGLYRWGDFAHLIPVGRETWRQRVLQGTAPRPERLGPRCTCWRGRDILAWLKDPKGYKTIYVVKN